MLYYPLSRDKASASISQGEAFGQTDETGKVKTMMSEYEKAKLRLRKAEKRYAEAVYDFYMTAANPEPSMSAGKYDFFDIGVICQAAASRKL